MLSSVVYALPVPTYAADIELSEEEMEAALVLEELINGSYSDYHDEYASSPRPDAEIIVSGSDYSDKKGENIYVGNYGGYDEADELDYEKKNVLIWDSSDGSVSYKINVEQAGAYNLYMLYYPIECSVSTIEFALKIDGELPYDTAQRLSLSKAWKNEHDITYDGRNNQIRPTQIQQGRWLESSIKDVDGLFNDPLLFYFSEGEHIITFEGIKANICIDTFKLYNEKATPAYSAPSAEELNATPGSCYRFEGESAAYKSDATLYATSDRTSYLASPSNPTKTRYNTIGAENWKKSLQSVTWSVSVENSGYYKLGIKACQNTMRGFYSNRRVYLDGKPVYDELNQIKFPYDSEWKLIVPKTDSGEDIYIYLEGGRKYELTLEAMPGEIGESMRKLDRIILELNQYYRKILMITSPNPDQYTDYYVHTKIPELTDEFQRIADELTAIKDDIESIMGGQGTEATTIERMTATLLRCVKNKFKIPQYLTRIKDNITALSSWMRDCRDQPLEIDYIELASSSGEFGETEESFFKSAAFQVKSFFGSFVEDYNTLSDVDGENKEAINVWVSLGRDQAQVLKQLVDSEFVTEYNIPINVNLVQGGIVEATLAGKGPDVALFTGGEFPVNLAVRGLLTDLKQFPDYKEVATRFQENATVMYSYDNGVYGLPVTQSFPMMFYRKDILAELGYSEPPQTWQGLIDMLPALQRKYLNVGLVLPTTAVTPTTEGGHTFAMLLLQNGKNYYNDALTETTFDSVDANQAFEMWTDFYTKYKFMQTYDAFSYFRTGEYPIVIQNYSFFNQLMVSAPEIKGLWDFTVVPGTKQEDGTISHAANSTGSGAIIFNKVKSADDAWTFIKWFTETDTQISYGTNIEGLMGQMGRFETANTEALSRLSWSTGEIEAINAQRAELVEIPIIPASYVVTRNVMSAFRETVNDAENPRDTLMKFNRDINAEITRKRKNLGLDEE